MFGTQILALFYVLAVLAAYGWSSFLAVLRRPPALFAAGLASVTLISVSQSGDRYFSLLVASWLALGTAIFVALLTHRPQVSIYLPAFVTGAALQAALGAWQFFTQSSPAAKWLGMAAHAPSLPGISVVETVAGRWLRAYGTFGHPNVYGFFIVLGVLACLGLIVARADRSREPLLALLPLLAAGAFFSFSRSAAVALAAGFIIYAPLAARRAAGVMPTVWLTAVILAAASVSFGLVYQEPALTRATAQGRLELHSWNERQTLAADALKLVSRHTALGVGAGEMPAAVWRELADTRDAWQYQEVHNLPLLVLVDIGVIGLAFWLLLVGWVVRSLWPAARSGGMAAAVPAAMLAAGLTAGLFDHFLWSSWPGQLLFWLICGLTAAEIVRERYPR